MRSYGLGRSSGSEGRKKMEGTRERTIRRSFSGSLRPNVVPRRAVRWSLPCHGPSQLLLVFQKEKWMGSNGWTNLCRVKIAYAIAVAVRWREACRSESK